MSRDVGTERPFRYCVYCGAQHLVAEKSCPTCGGPTATPIGSGIRGWLLVFTLLLTLAPLINVLFAAVLVYEAWWQSQPGKLEGALLRTAPNVVALAVLGCYALVISIRLWRIKPDAVEKLLKYLNISLAVGALLQVFDLSVGKVTFLTAALNFAGATIGFLIWRGYFRKSRRVKATFGRLQRERTG